MNYINIAHEVLDLEKQAIDELKNNIDDQFNALVSSILKCEGRVFISGIGKSGLIGKKIVATLASTGTPSMFLHPTEAYHGDLGMLKPIDLVILISNSGETDDVNKLIPSLKEFGNKIIAFTGNPNSTLAKFSDIVINIHVSREACPNNLAPTTSALVTLAIGDALAIALIKARDFKATDFARFHPGGSLGRRLLVKVKNEMKTNLPIVNPDDLFINFLDVINQYRMGLALVMQDDQLLGIITDGDIRRALAKYKEKTLCKQAKQLMSTQPKTIDANEFLANAQDMMIKHKIHCLIVTEHEKTVGIIEYND